MEVEEQKNKIENLDGRDTSLMQKTEMRRAAGKKIPTNSRCRSSPSGAHHLVNLWMELWICKYCFIARLLPTTAADAYRVQKHGRRVLADKLWIRPSLRIIVKIKSARDGSSDEQLLHRIEGAVWELIKRKGIRGKEK